MMICIKCGEVYCSKHGHEYLEVMTPEEMLQHESDKKNSAIVPPGQSPEDEEFKP